MLQILLEVLMLDMDTHIIIETDTILVDECEGSPIESNQASIRLLGSLIVDGLEAPAIEVLLVEVLVVIYLLQTTYVSRGEAAVQALLDQMTPIHPIGIDSCS
jgi:hypothetical protein